MSNREMILDIVDKVSGQSDMDWTEIRDKYMPNVNPDYLRKAGVGIKLVNEAGMLTTSSEVHAEESDELYILKQQFYDQRREYNKLLRDEARWEHVSDELIKSARRLNENKSVVGHYAGGCGDTSYEAVLVLSDWHYGMKTDNVWNSYNKEIASKRIQCIIDKCSEKLYMYDPCVLHIVLLGDMIHGAIHTTARIQSDENTVGQIMGVSELIAETIAALSACVPEIHVHCTCGNHARSIQNKQESIRSDNMEKIIPFWLNERFRDCENIHIHDVSDDMVLIRVFDTVVCGVHGDIDGTDMKSVLKLSTLCERKLNWKPDVIVSGHLHHINMNEELGITHIGVGSLCGTDEFANNARLYSEPSQTMMLFNMDGLDGIYNFKCGNTSEV